MTADKINLTLLNRLVKELNDQIQSFSKNPDIEKNYVDYVAELSKAYGFATAIALEASALTADISRLMKNNSSPEDNKEQSLSGILGDLFPLKPIKN